MAMFVADPKTSSAIAVIWTGVCSGCTVLDGIAGGGTTVFSDSSMQAQASNMPGLRWRAGSLATRAQQKTWIRSFTKQEDKKRPMQVQPIFPRTLTPSDSINNWLDVLQSKLFVTLVLNLSDQDTTWLDGIPVQTFGFGLSIICPHLGANWSEAVGTAFGAGSGLALLLTDQDTTWADAMFAGYGAATSDQLIIVDSLGAGYGGLLSDTMNSWTDSLQDVLGLALLVTDQYTTWTDAMFAGYGAFMSDQIIIVDSLGAGYGGQLSDSMNNWLDLVQLVEGLFVSLSDQDTTWAEALGIGYGLQSSDTINLWMEFVALNVGFSLLVTETLNSWLDLMMAGYGAAMSDQIIIVDSIGAGYGGLLSDSMNNWLDLLAFQLTGGAVLSLNLSDQDTTWLDALGIGYGNIVVDQLQQSDSLGAGYGGGVSDSTANWGDSLGAGYGNLIGDQDTTWADLAKFGVGFAVTATDQFVMLDSLLLGYGLLIADNLNSWLDLLQITTGSAILVLVLADALSWMDLLGIGYGMVFGDQITWLDSLLIIGIQFGKATIFDIETLLATTIQRIHVQSLVSAVDVESLVGATIQRIHVQIVESVQDVETTEGATVSRVKVD